MPVDQQFLGHFPEPGVPTIAMMRKQISTEIDPITISAPVTAMATSVMPNSNPSRVRSIVTLATRPLEDDSSTRFESMQMP